MEIKSCPFCGKAPKGEMKHTENKKVKFTAYSLSCCYARVRLKAPYVHLPELVKLVEAVWNKRDEKQDA